MAVRELAHDDSQLIVIIMNMEIADLGMSGRKSCEGTLSFVQAWAAVVPRHVV